MSRRQETQAERRIRKLLERQQRQQRLDQILQQQAQDKATKPITTVPRRKHIKWADSERKSLVKEARIVGESGIPRHLHGFNLDNIEGIERRLGPDASTQDKAALLEQAQIHYDKFRKNAENTILGNPKDINAVRLQFTKDCHDYLNGQIDANIRELDKSSHAVDFHQIETIGEKITTDTLAGYHRQSQNRERARGMHDVPPEVTAIRANLAAGKSTLWNTRAAARRGVELRGEHTPTHTHNFCISTRG